MTGGQEAGAAQRVIADPLACAAMPLSGCLRHPRPPLDESRGIDGHAARLRTIDPRGTRSDNLEPLWRLWTRLPIAPAGEYSGVVWCIGDLGPNKHSAFHVDRFEVTSRRYQGFVDKGGYQKRGYWKEKFVHDGRELSWEQATELLRDSSGRARPSWVGGRYPDGQEGYRVGGVNWDEAWHARSLRARACR